MSLLQFLTVAGSTAAGCKKNMEKVEQNSWKILRPAVNRDRRSIGLIVSPQETIEPRRKNEAFRSIEIKTATDHDGQGMN